MVKNLLSLSSLLILTACAALPTQPAVDALSNAKAGAVYKYDLSGTVNGTPFDGVGVIPYAKDYQMQIISRVDVDLLSISSCHRDFSVESAIHLGWFQSKRGYSYDYVPSEGIENAYSCLVRIGSYNRDKGQNAWGIVDFETPESTLPADNYCNGVLSKTNGVSICQSKIGLVERIVFSTPVRIADHLVDPKCKMTSKDAMTWEYSLAAGECVVYFQELALPNRLHRHTTVAYTDVMIRGNQ